MFHHTASVLFGVEGLQVTDAELGPDGTLEVWAVTGHPATAACPDCGTVSVRPHEQVLTRPLDVARGLDAVEVWWVKWRWKCCNGDCEYGRRGRSGDAEYGIKGLLVRNLAHLRPGQFAKITDTLGQDGGGQEILAAWIGKEKLRDVLNLRARVTGSTPCERDVRGRLARFYDWCAQNDDIPELLTLARTISRWADEVVAAVLTGVTNARSESLNRIAKLEARLAYSVRNPANQRRRVRTACTRGRSGPAAPPPGDHIR